jgi:hypothetical protein
MPSLCISAGDCTVKQGRSLHSRRKDVQDINKCAVASAMKKNKEMEPGMVEHAYNPSTRDAKAVSSWV